ncbi:MAG: DMT family transporter [Pseudomonadota bacterium]
MSVGDVVPRNVIPLPLAGLGVLLASVGFGLVPYFSRGLTEAGLAPHAVAFHRYIIAAVALLPVLYASRRAWRALLWGGAAGICMGMGWIGYVTALQTLPATTVGVLYMTYPVFTVLLAWAFFADRPTIRAIVSAGLIVVAALVSTGPFALAPEQIPVVLGALAAPLGFGFGICVLVHRLKALPPLARMASASAGSVLGLAPLVVMTDPAAILPSDPSDWGLLVGIALATALIPQLIYVTCAPLVGAARSAVIGSVELPTMFAVGVLAFGEALTVAQGVACALVLLAMGLSRDRTPRP